MVSIIIPTLNEEKFVSKLLNSIKKQNFNNYEIIVSDAGSTDNTINIAKKFTKNIIVSDKIKHPSHQRNEGAKLAKGDYFLFLDADSVIPNNFISKSITEFKRRQLACAGYYLKFNSRRIIYKFYDKVYKIICYFSQYYKPLSVGAAIISTKESHNKINGFDEKILVGEDHDYSRRIKKIDKFRMIKSTYFYYSPRRWEKEGHLLTLYKLFLMSLYMIFKGNIRRKIVEYKFGEH